jgi:tetratricopeptide (TPR) repeat protein
LCENKEVKEAILNLAIYLDDTDDAISVVDYIILNHKNLILKFCHQQLYLQHIEFMQNPFLKAMFVFYDRLIQLSSKKMMIEYLFGKAELLLTINNFQNAFQVYQRILGLNIFDTPRMVKTIKARAFCRLGEIYMRQSCIESAIYSFTKAFELDKQMLTALYCKGLSLLEQCQYLPAFKAFKECIQLGYDERLLLGNNIKFYNKLIQTEKFCISGEYKKAVFQFLQALMIFQNDSQAWQQDNEYSFVVMKLNLYFCMLLNLGKFRLQLINNFTKKIALNFQPTCLLFSSWGRGLPGGMLCYVDKKGNYKLFRLVALNFKTDLLRVIFNRNLMLNIEYVSLVLFPFSKDMVIFGEKQMGVIVDGLLKSPLKVLHLKYCNLTNEAFTKLEQLLIKNTNIEELVVNLSSIDNNNFSIKKRAKEFFCKVLRLANNPRYSLQKLGDTGIFFDDDFWLDCLYRYYKNKDCLVDLEGCNFLYYEHKLTYRKLWSKNLRAHKAKTKLASSFFAKVTKEHQLNDIIIKCQFAQKI